MLTGLGKLPWETLLSIMSESVQKEESAKITRCIGNNSHDTALNNTLLRDLAGGEIRYNMGESRVSVENQEVARCSV